MSAQPSPKGQVEGTTRAGMGSRESGFGLTGGVFSTKPKGFKFELSLTPCIHLSKKSSMKKYHMAQKWTTRIVGDVIVLLLARDDCVRSSTD